jgi:hypothetical protein
VKTILAALAAVVIAGAACARDTHFSPTNTTVALSGSWGVYFPGGDSVCTIKGSIRVGSKDGKITTLTSPDCGLTFSGLPWVVTPGREAMRAIAKGVNFSAAGATCLPVDTTVKIMREGTWKFDVSLDGGQCGIKGGLATSPPLKVK